MPVVWHGGSPVAVACIQFPIHGELTSMATRAQVVRPLDGCGTKRRQHLRGSQLYVVCLLATDTPQPSVVHRGRAVMQQLAEGGGTGAVQGRTDGHLNGFQIDATAVAPLDKDSVQEGAYLTRDLLMDCSTRFFPCAVQSAESGSTGRKRQICSLRAISSALRLCIRWNSATSRWALRKDAGLAKDSATDLPLTLRTRRSCGSWPGSSGFAQWPFGFPA